MGSNNQTGSIVEPTESSPYIIVNDDHLQTYLQPVKNVHLGSKFEEPLEAWGIRNVCMLTHAQNQEIRKVRASSFFPSPATQDWGKFDIFVQILKFNILLRAEYCADGNAMYIKKNATLLQTQSFPSCACDLSGLVSPRKLWIFQQTFLPI